MTAPNTLYDTEISHVRLGPVAHRFRHRSASWFIDVETPPRVPWPLRPLVDFRASDHLSPVSAGPDTLRRRVEASLSRAGIDPPDGRITALLNARCLGYVFDPLSVFWCHDGHGAVRAIVAEVHNTYGGRHAYVLDGSAATGARVDKSFFVSPFNAVGGEYRLRMPEPDARLAIDVVLEREGLPPFVARWRGTRRTATPRAILAAQVRAPLVPLVVAARIRLHGIRLWAAGLPLVPRPHTVEQEAQP